MELATCKSAVVEAAQQLKLPDPYVRKLLDALDKASQICGENGADGHASSYTCKAAIRFLIEGPWGG